MPTPAPSAVSNQQQLDDPFKPPPKPRAIDELSAEAEEQLEKNSVRSVKMWSRSGLNTLEAGNAARLQGDIEKAYILLLRAVLIRIDLIPQLKDYRNNSNDNDYLKLKERVEVAMKDLAILKEKQMLRIKEYEERFPAKGPRGSPQFPRSPIAQQRKTPSDAGSDAGSVGSSVSQRAKYASATPPPQSTAFSSAASQASSWSSTSSANVVNSAPVQSRGSSVYDVSKSLILPMELYEVLNEARLSVLVIDVRGVTDWYSGHLRWKGWQAARNGGMEVRGGVLHIESEWLNSQTDSRHLEETLSSFPSNIPLTSSRHPLNLFSYRHEYDLVVIYDAHSQSSNDSHVLHNLMQAIYGMEVMKRLKNTPKILSGGWIEWVKFLNQRKGSGIVMETWMEIGDGENDFDQGAPLPLRNARASSAGTGSNGQLGLSNGVGGGYARSTGDFIAQRTQQLTNHFAPDPGRLPGSFPATNGNAHNPFSASTHVTIGNQASAAPVIVAATQPQPASVSTTWTAQPGYGQSAYGSHSATGYGQNITTNISSPFFGMGGGYSRAPTPPDYGRYDAMGGQTSVSTYPALPGHVANGIATTAPIGAYPSLAGRQALGQESVQIPPPIPSKPVPQDLVPPRLHSTTPPGADAVMAGNVGVGALGPLPYQPIHHSSIPLQPTKPTVPYKPLPLPPIPIIPTQPYNPARPAHIQVPAPAIRRSSSPSPSPSTTRFYGQMVQPGPRNGAAPALPPKPNGLGMQAPTPPSMGSLGFGASMGMAGLRNMGNTCFMNSILQCMSGTVPLARYFNDGSYRRHINKENSLGTKGDITISFAELIRSMWGESGGVVVPGNFKERVGNYHPTFKGNEQQDSQEFLNFLLDSMHEDLNIARKAQHPRIRDVTEKEEDEEHVPDEVLMDKSWERHTKLNWSIVVDMFQGALKSRLECLTCGKSSTTFNTFMFLTLPVPHNGRAVRLSDCLDEFLKEEILDGDDAWKCPRCKVKRRTKKQLAIAKLPVVLLVHLKRFHFEGPFRNRIDTYVDFPTKSLDLTRYVPQHFRQHVKKLQRPLTAMYKADGTRPGGQMVGSGFAPVVSPKADEYVYDLYAVSNHSGGLNGGHYTAQVKNGYRDKWYNFDDSRISECREADVKSSQAYILFYWRVRPDPIPTMADWWIHK
ncbi:ubiquitin-specific protease doa4 [Rhizophlyctis rosea]|uniref:ubiquitinyl hydrolase 1 n=1 Tax=Rhizophlyctis rosea TaxID=64517 RepID=A0AAD5S9Q9_9FUNG|nr:ubiquitin-specific protease doa4 [Rhizophlyctis rosea]